MLQRLWPGPQTPAAVAAEIEKIYRGEDNGEGRYWEWAR